MHSLFRFYALQPHGGYTVEPWVKIAIVVIGAIAALIVLTAIVIGIKYLITSHGR